MSTQRKQYSGESSKPVWHSKPSKGSPSKVLLFFGNFVPLARRRDPVKEGQGCRWHWGKSSNRLWNSARSV